MTTDDLSAGLALVERRQWEEAYQLLQPMAATRDLSAADTDQLAEAAFWSNRVRESLQLRELAFAGYEQNGTCAAAARAGLRIAMGHVMLGSIAVGGGWFAKVKRILADLPECSEHGELVNTQAHFDIVRGDLETALANAREAYAVGERVKDPSLQASALNTIGAVLIRLGEVVEGTTAIDESMASAIAGDLRPFDTAAIYCTTISACQRIGDLRRATEWTDAAENCAARTGLHDFPGDCRAHRVSILRVNGNWDDAEEAAALTASIEGAEPSHVATVHQEIGELRVYRGEFEAAETAFRAAEALGRNPQPGRALFCLAKGETQAAASFISTALQDQDWDMLARARLLPAQVQIALAVGDEDKAQCALAELREIAATYQTIALQAVAQFAEGLIDLHAGNLEAALTSLRGAMRRWFDLPAPFEAAQARLAMARALDEQGNYEVAEIEARAALTTFERLRATLYAEQAAGLLDKLSDINSSEHFEPSRVERTFMFTDIVSSTALLDAIGDDAWSNLVQWHDRKLRQQFDEHDGEEVDHAGDGFFVAFQSADAALDCAIEIQRALQNQRKEHGFSPSVRIGLHVAEATSDVQGYTGMGVHHAARIGAAAGAGEVLASREVLEAASIDRETSQTHELELKGISELTTVVSVVC